MRLNVKISFASFLLYSTTARISPDALVCHTATLDGDITIGARTVVHPKATIIAKDGPIVIGEGNLIEEQTIIVNKYVDFDFEFSIRGQELSLMTPARKLKSHSYGYFSFITH